MEDYKLSIQETERINEALHTKMRALDIELDDGPEYFLLAFAELHKCHRPF